MKKEWKTGDMFCIEGIKTYPKLKTDYGYIDMRDRIKISRPVQFSVSPMTNEEVATFFECNEQELYAYIGELLSE